MKTVDFEEIAAFIERVCRDSDHPVANFWRGYWLQTGHLRRLILMLEKVSSLFDGNPSILDIGGFGELLLILRKFYGLTSVHGASLEGNAFGFKDGRLRSYDDSNLEHSIRIDACDVERERLKHAGNSLDIVTCFEVLEHLRYDPMFMLLEIHRVLRPGGVLILSTPNASSWECLARVAALESPFTFSSYFADGTGIGHCKEYSALELRQVLVQAGFSIDKFETVDFAPIDSGLESRFGELKAFVSSQDWWNQNLRGQTLLIEARKTQEPMKRMYAPLYTDELLYSAPKERPPEHDADDGQMDSSTQDSYLKRDSIRLRKYVTVLQADIEARTQWALRLEELLKQERATSTRLQSDFDELLKQERAAFSKLATEFDERGRWARDQDTEIHRLRKRIVVLEHMLGVHNLAIRGPASLIKRLWHKIWH